MRPSMSTFKEGRSNAHPVPTILPNPSVQEDIEGHRHLRSDFDAIHHTVPSTGVGGPRPGHSPSISRDGGWDVPHQFQQQSRRPHALEFPVTPEPIPEAAANYHDPILSRQSLPGGAASDACPPILNRDLQFSDDCSRLACSPSFQYPSLAFSGSTPDMFGVNVTQRLAPCCEPVMLPTQPVHTNLPGTHNVLSWAGYPMETYNPPSMPVPDWRAFQAPNIRHPVGLEGRKMDPSGFPPSVSTQPTNPPISHSYYSVNSSSAGAIPPGADNVPATPAEQSTHILSKQCGWKDRHGSVCNIVIGYECQGHFADAHGITKLSGHKTVSCQWCEPKKILRRRSFLRHVREAHLRVSRSKRMVH